MKSLRRRVSVCVFTALPVLLAISIGEPSSGRAPKDGTFQAFDRLLKRGHKDRNTGELQRVATDGPEAAARYYERVATELGCPDNTPPKTLDALLIYFGYTGISAADCEQLEPQLLMDAARLGGKVNDPSSFRVHLSNRIQDGDIIATRFFAPKTTDVSRFSESLAPSQRTYSWRKLIRLRAQEGSLADRHGASVLYWMSNAYRQLHARPFHGAAQSNQVIIARSAASQTQDNMYWLLYESLDVGGGLTDSAPTSWDALTTEDTDTPDRKYYVPNACIHCHGGLGQLENSHWRGKLSYLDTDHWLDRVQPADDFSDLGRTWPVLFDAGVDETSNTFRVGFDALLTLNQEIYEQNRAVEDTGFETRAVATWLTNHKQSIGHVSLAKRGIPGRSDPSCRWSENDQDDVALLRLLNRYCFRCHSNLLFNVFDKEAVLSNVDEMHDRVAAARGLREYDSYAMPQDRWMSEDDREALCALLERLKQAAYRDLDK